MINIQFSLNVLWVNDMRNVLILIDERTRCNGADRRKDAVLYSRKENRISMKNHGVW